ncbi:hypothetical protein BDV39DRAFT_208787 [Aspergillus sergii]|uniref:Uncharacterized protein n=1 Tax=Aspergillus sergii TaxID=1034303 RepID=A0A5N6WS73_9EURO|nr:hypothetical protein BDV39DRAFT_208787 [Aspergillus sergii]
MRLVRWSPFVDPEIPESATNQFGDNKFHFTLDPVLHKVFAFAAPLLPVDLTLTRVHRSQGEESPSGELRHRRDQPISAYNITNIPEPDSETDLISFGFLPPQFVGIQYASANPSTPRPPWPRHMSRIWW